MKLYPVVMADGSQGDLFAGVYDDKPVFDHKKSWEDKQAGQAQAEAHLIQWKIDAERWVTALGIGSQFTADDLVSGVGLPSDTDGRPNNNGVGAFISGLKKRGLIASWAYTTSDRVTNHNRVLRLWRVVA